MSVYKMLRMLVVVVGVMGATLLLSSCYTPNRTGDDIGGYGGTGSGGHGGGHGGGVGGGSGR